jgi:hypothetical protein
MLLTSAKGNRTEESVLLPVLIAVLGDDHRIAGGLDRPSGGQVLGRSEVGMPHRVELVARIVGRPARDFTAWASNHSGKFAQVEQ